MSINKSLYEYAKCKDVFLLGKKDYKWYDRAFSRVVEEFNEMIAKNEKLDTSFLHEMKKVNMPIMMMVSNKRLDLMDNNRKIVNKQINLIDNYVNEKKLYLDDKNFFESFANYKTCLSQYFTLNRMEYLSKQIKDICLEDKKEGNLMQFVDLIDNYLSQDEYKNYNFAPIEVFTIAPIELEKANLLFGELYHELQTCKKIEDTLKNNNPKQ